jgi:hypothetical protein
MTKYIYKDKTQIQVDISTREQLKKLGSKGQSYDSLVKQLLELRERHKDEL